MANEATIRTTLQIRKSDDDGNVILDYQSRPSGFTADVDGSKGPCPGSIAVSVSGTDIDFSQLTTPGLCRIMNQDSTNYVTLGVYEPDTDFFYPILEFPPFESYVVRLARFLETESTGTGTLVGYNSRLQLRANTDTCNVLVEAFER